MTDENTTAENTADTPTPGNGGLIKKIAILVIIAMVVGAAWKFGLFEALTLENLKAQQGKLNEMKEANFVVFFAAFFVIYTLAVALSLPGATIMTLAAGALFGTVVGTLLVSFASSIGATIACFFARYLLRDWVQGKFGNKIKPINDGIEKEGAFYLFGMRLVPIFPFFAINLTMGLTPIKLWTFYWVSQVGMFAGTVVYVNAGTQLSKIDSLKGLAKPELIVSFVALGVLPIILKKVLNVVKKSRAAKA